MTQLRWVLGVVATALAGLAQANSFPQWSGLLSALSIGVLALLHQLPRAKPEASAPVA